MDTRKWPERSAWCFLAKKRLSDREILDLIDTKINYFADVALTQNVDPVVLYRHFQDRGIFRDTMRATRNEYFALAILAALNYVLFPYGEDGLETEIYNSIKAKIEADVKLTGFSVASPEKWITLPPWIP